MSSEWSDDSVKVKAMMIEKKMMLDVVGEVVLSAVYFVSSS